MCCLGIGGKGQYSVGLNFTFVSYKTVESILLPSVSSALRINELRD